MSGDRQRRREATYRAGHQDGLTAAETEKNVFKGKYRSIVTLLNDTRQKVQEIFDHIEDEGDRVYFGSTNHADWLRELLDDMDGWSFDAMLPKGDINKMEADPYAEIRAQRVRADAAEAAMKQLREAVSDLCAAYSACNGEDHPAYVAARTALAKTEGDGNGR
ncbi:MULTISPECIES: hypothetical protein [unclassified Agrobacterium]|uniref:hypothetical protein n=1 Tax=unclassified Agrobacterium TaxID=2632611 RepID=UPI002448D019|nr:MULTISPECIES: hypothetical protein [unclassified Agrobacterium]MDH0615890.1 hypothetical protein [Agrobacterium sp. GD03872]MDH0698005.1 hypothetical protein [Agrobacterium sp. GD03871]MDH1061090.1 hypothetical protein [Agrobacterium sp. GD03992]MDH2211878.1 hypothetical protein [Agrobacterium sp. GD03643]MDH2221270.1 hypothetical protein [Agrobacterium sp. GD03638]